MRDIWDCFVRLLGFVLLIAFLLWFHGMMLI